MLCLLGCRPPLLITLLLLDVPTVHLGYKNRHNTGIGPSGGLIIGLGLAEGAKAGLKLKSLKLGRSRLENKGAISIAAALEAMGSLKELVLPQNGIKTDGIVALARAIEKNADLRVLNLNDNTFKPESCIAIAKALKATSKLEVLNLGDCLLNTPGFLAIAASIGADCTSLRDVDLSFNNLGAKVKDGDAQTLTCDAIVRLVAGKSGLEKLTLDGNVLGEGTLQQIGDAVAAVTGKDADEVLDLEDMEDPDDEEDEDEDEDADDDDDGLESDDEETVAADKDMVEELYTVLKQ
jgi:Ran GTPase-activating protein 1